MRADGMFNLIAGRCEHGFDRPHYALPVNGRDCDATPVEVLAYVATLPGAERHDDVVLQFVVDGRIIYTRERGDYLVVPWHEKEEKG